MEKNIKYESVYKFLWLNIKPYKWYYFAMLLAPVMSSFYGFANSYSLKLVVDAFSLPGPVSYSTLAWPIAIFVSANILVDVIWRLADIAEWRSEPYVRRSLLTESYNYVQHHSFTYFQNTPGGTITSRIKGILDGYDNFWAAMHHDFSAKLANTIVLTAVIAIVNVQVCLLVSLWVVIFIAVMYRFSKTIDRLSFEYANSKHKVLGLVADNINNIFTIFSFATKKSETHRLREEFSDSAIPANIRFYKFSFLANWAAGMLYWIMLISLFLFMIHLRMTNKASNGDVVFVMTITITMSHELWQLIQKMQSFMKNVGDMKSSFEILKIPHDPKELEAREKLIIVKPSVSFEHIYFSYDKDRAVFQDLSLSIKPGEKIGLVGTSGAGKSSLVSLLLKYFRPDQGRILIDGQDISNYSADSVREHIAIIPQDIVLFHRSILENIRYGNLLASRDEVIAAAKMANVHDFILDLPEQYDTMVGERGIKLSGGQRQRIAIARAILKNAPILILDEATSSLDTKTEQLIQSSLISLLDSSNSTVIAIAHRLSTIKHMDRIIVLSEGKIVEQGNHETLINQGLLYQKLWELQKI